MSIYPYSQSDDLVTRIADISVLYIPRVAYREASSAVPLRSKASACRRLLSIPGDITPGYLGAFSVERRYRQRGESKATSCGARKLYPLELPSLLTRELND